MPPVMSLSNSKPSPGSARRAAWCARTGRCRRSASCACSRIRPWLRMVSRYATCGLPTLAPTLNSRCMRSTMISRCSSPMPARMVCPVSGSVVTRSVGSSCTSFCNRHAQLFLIGLGLGLDGELNHRLREIDRFSSRIGFFSSQIVSPVETFFRPPPRRYRPPEFPECPRACWRAS